MFSKENKNKYTIWQSVDEKSIQFFRVEKAYNFLDSKTHNFSYNLT